MTDEVKKQIKLLGYRGCKNCKHQISPLRMCEWGEHGNYERINLICPKWAKVESEDVE